MGMTRTERERIRERAERTARCELVQNDRREHTTVEDPETNRQMMLKKRIKWRRKFNTLGLLIVGGFISIFHCFLR